jgi:hypothetical protein
MNTQKLEAKIDAVVSGRKNSAKELQEVLIELLLHVYKHGNYPIVNRLLSGVKNTKDYKPVTNWIEAFIHLEIEDGVATGWKGAEAIKETYATARTTDWQTFKPKKEDKPLDAGKSLSNLTKRITDALKTGEELPIPYKELEALLECYGFTVKLQAAEDLLAEIVEQDKMEAQVMTELEAA